MICTTTSVSNTTATSATLGATAIAAISVAPSRAKASAPPGPPHLMILTSRSVAHPTAASDMRVTRSTNQLVRYRVDMAS